MNINVANGVRKITLTKGEKATLRKACDLCGELEHQISLEVARGAAQKACIALEALQSCLAADATESEPKAAAAR